MQEKIENNTKTIDRIYEYITYLGQSLNKLSIELGLSNSYFSKMLKNKGSVGSDIIENILRIHPDLNADWLITGRGSMLKEKQIEDKVVINNMDTSYIYEMYKDYKNLQEKIHTEKNIEIKELHAKIEKQNDTIITLIAENKELEARLDVLDPLQLPPVGDVFQKKSLLSQIQPIASAPVRIEKGKAIKNKDK